MFRLTLQGVTVECDTVDEAFALTGLARPEGSFPRVTEPCKPAHLNSRPTKHAPLAKGAMAPTGKTKECKRCKAKFPVLTRSDCAATRCHGCRGIAVAVEPETAADKQVAKKAAAQAAKTLLGRPAIKPDEPTASCNACQDKARVSDLDKFGRCRDCQPVGGKS